MNNKLKPILESPGIVTEPTTEINHMEHTSQTGSMEFNKLKATIV